MTAPQTDATTDPQSTIAALQQRLDEGLAREAALAEALAQRNSEYGDRIEQQSATIDVLKAMSASPGYAQAVFELIVERARDLCDAYGASLWEYDGTLIHLRASNGISDDPAVKQAVEAIYPMVPSRERAIGRAILDRQNICIDDYDTDPEASPATRGITVKSTVVIPLMRAGEPIGGLGVGSRERGGFSDRQVELMKTFAEQAVIAITSAETYRALQTRTNDLQETLENQTATSDVLKVISRSTFNLRPVLQAVIETAARLCDADMAMMFHRERDGFRMAVNHGYPAELEDYWAKMGAFPIDLETPASGHRAARERRAVHVPDVTAVPGYPEALHRLGGQRTSLSVPLLRNGEAIGVIGLGRRRVQPFTYRQIELVSTFADQAVIAIENTRLMTEQREALEQQTATAEVLQVINANPGDLTPVFDAILDKAHTLCGAVIGSLVLFDGTHFRAVATHGLPEQVASLMRHPMPPNSRTQQLIDGMRFRQIEDIRAIWVNGDYQIMRALGGIHRYAHCSICAAAQGRCPTGLYQRLPTGGPSILGQGDRVAGELRRPGSYRYRERTAAD